MYSNYGNWVVEKELGKGGFGQALRVHNQRSGQRACLKTAEAQHGLEALIAEAQVLQGLKHANIAGLIDAGSSPEPFLVSEYIPGETLFEEIVGDGSLDETQWMRLAVDILSALSYTEGKKLVHRDLHVKNIMRSARRSVLIDFGTSIFTKKPESQSLGWVGVPEFMSPEAFSSFDRLTPKSDVFQFASCLYFAGTGKLPFVLGEAADPTAIQEQILRMQVDYAGLTNNQVQLLKRMHDKNPATRISAKEALNFAEKWAGHSPMRLPSGPPVRGGAAVSPRPAATRPWTAAPGIGTKPAGTTRQDLIAALKIEARRPNVDIRPKVQSAIAAEIRAYVEKHPQRPLSVSVGSGSESTSLFAYRESRELVDLVLKLNSKLDDRKVASLVQDGWTPIGSTGLEYTRSLVGSGLDPKILANRIASVFAVKLALGVAALENLQIGGVR